MRYPKTKKTYLVILSALMCHAVFAQEYGNIGYRTEFQQLTQYQDHNIELANPSASGMTVTIKGMANLKADNYVAIFNVTQVGKTAEEVNTLMDTRINEVLTKLKTKQGLETYVDMLSFVPVYEYESDKKVFNKKSYNEIPKGFELKKNIHIKFTDHSLMNEIIATMASSEIYDLVRVDYFSDKMEATKLELVNKSKTMLQDKLKNYKQVIGTQMDSTEKLLIDGFKVVYPIEMYRSYQAYSNTELNMKKTTSLSTVYQVEKSTTQYYQPVVDKEFDFVINPTILEPVIQVMYEIKVELVPEEKANPSNEYYIVTPNGDVKKIPVRS